MANPYGARLFDHHAKLLADSAITPHVAAARGYVSVDQAAVIHRMGFSKKLTAPGLLIPVWNTAGEVALHEYRPDNPRLDNKGRPRKYEKPWRSTNVVDVPPPARDHIRDPAVPLWITEGARKADAAVSAGLCCVALLGVYGWRNKETALPDWESIALKDRLVLVCFDNDVMTKTTVQDALQRLTGFLAYRGANVAHVILPGTDGGKVGLDDYLAAGGTPEQLRALAQPAGPGGTLTEQPSLLAGSGTSTSNGTRRQASDQRKQTTGSAGSASVAEGEPPPQPRDLAHAHDTYTRWLGKAYDLQVLDVVLAVAAATQLDGDPPWLLVVGGSGAAKTETVAPLAGAGAYVESTITSEAALLSGTPQHEHAKDATGGLLAKIGNRGLLVLKDFTSIISMNRDARAMLLAALREIHDGKWTRNVGAEGGRTLSWSGRLVLIGATTTAYDKAHSVIAAMGDRFALVRQDSAAGAGRTAAGRQALANVGNEATMRAELSQAVAAVLAGVHPERATLTEADHDILLQLADVVTLARTGVDHDYRGEVIDAHAPEMPTRFAKMLGQIVRGGLALGMTRTAAVAAAVRVAGDSMPPLRLAALADVAANPDSTLSQIKARLQKPRATIDRTLQALHILGLLTQSEDRYGSWTYRLSPQIDPTTVAILVTRNVRRHPLPLGEKASDQMILVTRNVGRHPLPLGEEASDRLNRPAPEGGSDISGNPAPEGGSDISGNQDQLPYVPQAEPPPPAGPPVVAGSPGQCVAPGCDRPPRRACRTCWDHRDLEANR